MRLLATIRTSKTPKSRGHVTGSTYAPIGMELTDYLCALGVRVLDHAPSRSNRWAEWCSQSRTIRIDPALGPRQYAYALAHEAGHAFHDHSCSWPPWEREADIFAATWLIHRDEWEKAVKMHSTAEAVAHELGVLPHVVRTYHSHLEREP